jgi:hypothetical protein
LDLLQLLIGRTFPYTCADAIEFDNSHASLGGCAMVCNVCGLEYGLSHNCAGPLSTAGQAILSDGLEAPKNGGLGYYLGEAAKIARWDDVAIRRNARRRFLGSKQPSLVSSVQLSS